MIIPQDDLLGHQIAASFAHTQTSDPAWMERLWYTAHPVPEGDVILNVGIGLHPNRDVMDAHAGITVEGKQHNLRLSRRLGRDAAAMEIGPLKIEVLEGMRRHRLTLAPNESGLTFDVEYVSDLNPHEEAHRQVRRRNRVMEDLVRYQQAGRYSGWVEVAGKRYELDPAKWWGQRDHSWGVRAHLRTDEAHPPVTPYPGHVFLWCVAQFEHRAVQMFLMDRGPGDYLYLSGEEVLPKSQRPDPRRLIRLAEHDIVWSDDGFAGQSPKSMGLKLTFADGSTKLIRGRPLPARFFLKGGMYGGLNGWFQGDDKGAFHSEHDVWDLSDPEDRKITRTLADNVFEFRDGDEVGYGIVECWVIKGYPRYHEVQDRLAP